MRRRQSRILRLRLARRTRQTSIRMTANRKASPTLGAKTNTRRRWGTHLAYRLVLSAGSGSCGFFCLLAALDLDHLVALGAELEERLGFGVEAGHVAVDDGFPDDAGR